LTPPTTITPVYPASSSPIFPIRWFPSITTKAKASSSTKPRASLLTLGFGCFFFDYDLDGWPDIFIANGHIDSDIERVQPNVKYAMPPHLFRNLGKGNFQEVVNSLGKSFNTPRVGRGAAYADINNDGRPDLLLSTNGGPVYLFLNEAAGPAASNKSLRIKLVGTKSNRDGIGAVAKLTAGGESQTQTLRSGSSYLSASELILTFGLGQNSQTDVLEIRWPSGQIDKLTNIPAGQTITITESKGITNNHYYNNRYVMVEGGGAPKTRHN
jgi:enediyne biosynthesis protein E4